MIPERLGDTGRLHPQAMKLVEGSCNFPSLKTWINASQKIGGLATLVTTCCKYHPASINILQLRRPKVVQDFDAGSVDKGGGDIRPHHGLNRLEAALEVIELWA